MEGLLEGLIPLAGVGMIVLIVVVPVWLVSHYRSKDRARLHETVRLMVEKGQPVSSEMLASLNSNPSRYNDLQNGGSSADIRRGVIMIGVALAMVGLGFGLSFLVGIGVASTLVGSAAFPGFIGLGFVVVGLLNRSKPKA